jgi:hypothetical protein
VEVVCVRPSVRPPALNNAPFLSSSTCGCYQAKLAKLGNLAKCSAVLAVGEHCVDNCFYFLILSFCYLRRVTMTFTIIRSQRNALTKWCHTFHSRVNYCQVTQCAATVVACYYDMSKWIRNPHVSNCPWRSMELCVAGSCVVTSRPSFLLLLQYLFSLCSTHQH